MKRIILIMLNKLFKPLIQRQDASLQKQETTLLAVGKLLARQQSSVPARTIHDYEFKIFSQRGEDGIIQWLVQNIQIKNKTFIEFGVEDYMESNTRFLMMNDNWGGLVIDGSSENITKLSHWPYFWQYDLTAKCAFIDKDNINELLISDRLRDIGLLSVDIDGNDYWVFEAINLSHLNPAILVLEYNGLFPIDRAISVPYDKTFNRTKAHHSNLYFGASLAALAHLAGKRGYSLVGCNSIGSNAFFVRNDLLNEVVQARPLADAYVGDTTRQSRDKNGNLSLLSGEERLAAITGMEVVNVLTGETERL